MLLILYVGAFLLLPDSSQILAIEVCSIGSNVQVNLSNSETISYSGKLYLNTAEPACCNGTITSVDYCYYRPSQHNSNKAWVAGVTLYRSQADGNYSRVIDGLPLIKLTPWEQDSYNHRTDLLFCDTIMLNSMLHVQKGDIVGALILLAHSFQLPNSDATLGGLDLVGDSSSGYQMLTKSVALDGIRSFSEIRNYFVQLLDASNGLSRDNERRILHVYANITPAPESDPSACITPSRDSNIAPSKTLITTSSSITVLRPGTITATVTKDRDPYSTTNSTTVTTSIVKNKPMTENKKPDNIIVTTESSTQPMPIAVESSPPLSIIIGILGAIVIIGMLISIVIVLAILHRRIRKQPHMSTKRAINLKNPSVIECDRNALGNMEMETYSEPIDQRTVPFTTELNEYAVVGPNTSKAEHGTMEVDHFYFVLDHFYFVLEGPKCPYTELLEKNKAEDIYEHVTRYYEPAKQERDLYSQIKSFGIRHIDRDSIQIQNQVLGSGQFGSVKSGVWKTGQSEVKVAVKSLNQGISEETRVKFLQEAAIMAQFRHPNVAFLYGVVIEGQPIMLVVELVEKGDLRKCLMSIKSNPSPGEISSGYLPNLLLSFSQHVALGMQYLSGKGFVHRDLAARNILVSKNNVCKVADFGMSRDLADENYYVSHGGMIPVKWTAPEAIHYKKYSTASDVWSYGCLLYEVWSLALQPFENIGNLEVIQMLDKGERLAPPSASPRIIYELMIQCWHPTVTSRPSFRELVLTLTGDKRQVLLIPQRDGDTHPLARVLGAPLEAGKNMYKDLQNRYII